MACLRRKPASLLALLYGIVLIFAAATMKFSLASEESELPEEGTKLEKEQTYDPHFGVLVWLKNRASHAEDYRFVEPWKDYDEDEDEDEYRYQNGYYFSKKKLNILTGDSMPRIVASEKILKGELLVGVPSNSFIYRHQKKTYKILHPCDVASKMLNARTYRYPERGEESSHGNPSLDNFVRPFLDSILSLWDHSDNNGIEKNRHFWSLNQLDSLTKILGNELDPKANTLVLWADDKKGNETSAENKQIGLPTLCQHPNTKDKETNRIINHFYNESNPRAEEHKQLFKTTLATIVTRSWNHRMVPIYHLISRSDDFNVVHSETSIDRFEMKNDYWPWSSDESQDSPTVYQLHASRDIEKGETIVLPYHSIAQKFATEGRIGSGEDAKKDADDAKGASYRFWTQTLHDQWGTDFMFGDPSANPYNDYLVWDYFPKSQTIEWVHKSRDIQRDVPKQTLRATQRNVLQAQYLRLRSMEEEVHGLLLPDPNDPGNLAIVEYYELWVESLGLVLAHARPNREITDENGKELNVCPVEATSKQASEDCASAAAYDDLKERFYGDQIDYNRYVASHDCTNLFKQTTYEETKTPYAHLEWTRSYIGGGSIGDHQGDKAKEIADDREQDTCLHLENVLHSCLAFRPHVHETLIHYPASFLPKDGMKRILYVGGGDLVLLHELLRYKSVELVIGMEIDQTVLRHSFRHYGIQPKFEDERVHWWFGDAAKSLTLLPPEEYFGTFDMVLIDLVVEIFESLRVGDHNERLVDYMAKLLKPEGILVRQEDWPLHNVVDFAKYTVDLNVFGMPHTCSQYFTMASNTIDFANQERVDHELEDLVWYEPNVGSHDHMKMWGDYRNNLDPPERICNEPKQESTHVLPSNGLFLAIEAENVNMDLGELPSVQAAVTKALDGLGFIDIDRRDISVSEPSASSMLFIFEEGYLALRTFPKEKFVSMDLQLWNDVSKREIAVSALVAAIGGDSTTESTSTFVITTGGMFGTSNIKDHSSPMIPSTWCKGYSADEGDETSNGVETLSGFNIVVEEMLTNVLGKEYSTVFVLCPDESTHCRAKEDIYYGAETKILLFEACPAIASGNESSLEECEQQMLAAITKSFPTTSSKTEKIRAIVIDPEVPRELGQIATKLFVNDPTSYQWLSHDFILLVPFGSDPASTSSGYRSSWRYQLLERFRTDMIEFHPVYHATIAFRYAPSALSELAIGVLSAGNPGFYGHLVDSMDAIRGNQEAKFQEVILVETKIGAVSHIPDYQPSKWATPSDYDIEPAKKQYSEQQPIGAQILVQHEKVPDIPHDIKIGDTVIFYRDEQDDWCGGYIDDILDDEFEDDSDDAIDPKYVVITEAQENVVVKRHEIVKFDYKDETPRNDTIPFGTIMLADGTENNPNTLFFPAQVLDRHNDGRYKVYHLVDGSYVFLKRNQLAPQSGGSFESPSDAKMFPTCKEFYEMVEDEEFEPSGSVFKREIGDGCLVVMSWSEEGIGHPTTLVATYDGQINLSFNVYTSHERYKKREDPSQITKMANRDFPETERKQIDFHPRGYGRVVNFKHDLKRSYFGTKYPKPLSEI